ncbi:MAG: TonB-dependent receptor plug domain-containing protein [Bacteroidota bacterium]
MEHIKKILILFSLSLIFLNIRAQEIKILNESTQEPVSNVALFTNSKNIATLSDARGIANISIFKETDSIFFQHSSYNSEVYLKNDLIRKPLVYLSKRIILIDEFVISATRTRESESNVAFQIDVLENDHLIKNTSQTSAELLQSTGNIVIQKSQGGGGSPIMRGFEANKVLLVLDGVRMNNAIYRSGHLQNSITVDNIILDRVEVIYGPTSLIYGSDALGGVIHYYTKDPEFSGEKGGYNFQADALSRYSTVNKGKFGHLSINQGFNKIAFLTSISYKDMGDIKMGEKRNPFYGDFGLIKHYAGRVNGTDTMLNNPDPHVQKNTGYSQLDLMQKIKYSPSRYQEWILNLQYSTSSNIDRLDKLNDYSGDQLKYAEYYYGPQNRLFTSLKSFYKKENILFTNMTSIFAYQRIDEDRITRRFRNNKKFVQNEDVSVLSLNLDFLKLIYGNRINYGLQALYNNVASGAWYRNIETNEKSPGTTRYPDGGTSAWSVAAYANYKWKPSEKTILSAGARYHFGAYSSGFNPESLLPYENVRIDNGALTGSLNLIYNPGRNWRISAIASTGFRNPNVDDYGKVRAKDNQVTVPNPDLNSEYTWNIEAGLTKTIEGYIKISAVGYYTLLTNAIVRTDYQLNGMDSLEYDGEMYQIITNANANRAYITGLSFKLLSDLNSNLSFRSTLNITEGRNISNDVPLGHIPPVFGRSLLKYHIKKSFTDVYIDYHGWKRKKDMSPYEEDNDAEATQYGFPSWYTVNIRAGYNLSQNFQIQLAVENIFDTFYKPFASGIAGPGRNFIFTLRANIN